MTTEDRIIEKLVEMDASIKGIQEHMVTKEDLRKTKSEILTHIDGFAKRQEVFDHELVAMGSRLDRLQGQA